MLKKAFDIRQKIFSLVLIQLCSWVKISSGEVPLQQIEGDVSRVSIPRDDWVCPFSNNH